MQEMPHVVDDWLLEDSIIGTRQRADFKEVAKRSAKYS